MGIMVKATLALVVAVSATPALAATEMTAANAACQPLVAPLPEAQRKFHPGHYVSIGPAVALNGLQEVVGKGVVGVQLRYRWAELEPSEGQYQFARVARDLAAAKQAGLQLVVMIEDKSFKDQMPTPDYLQGKSARNRIEGYTAFRWDAYVNERLKLLVAGLGAAFDCDPNLEGVAFQESSPSLEEAELNASGYTPEKYRDALISQLKSASTSMPRSRVFWYMNFLPGGQRYIGDIASAVVGTGVVMGGPDILPDNRALQRRVYPFYDQFQGRLKLFGSMQHNSYRHRHGDSEQGGSGYWSMEDLFAFARDKLHVDYVFWDYQARRQPPDAHDFSDARAVIASHPVFR
jgi:hypothetical protein